MPVTHVPKAGAELTGAEWEDPDTHVVDLDAADVGAAPEGHAHEDEPVQAVGFLASMKWGSD